MGVVAAAGAAGPNTFGPENVIPANTISWTDYGYAHVVFESE